MAKRSTGGSRSSVASAGSKGDLSGMAFAHVKDLSSRTLLIKAVSVLLCGHALLLYGLSLKYYVPCLLVAGLGLLALPAGKGMLLSLTVNFISLTLLLIFPYTPFPSLIWGSPAQMLSDYDPEHQIGRYRPNMDVEILVRKRDLRSMEPALPEGLDEPAPVRFQTDALGFRNSRELSEQELILIGDSFIVAGATSQADILSEKLSSAGLSAYNFSFPGDPVQYARFLTFYEQLPEAERARRIYVFLFEGNDFITEQDEQTQPDLQGKKQRSALKRLFYLYEKTLLFRTMYVCRANLENAFGGASSTGGTDRPSPVQVLPLGDGQMGFLKSYVGVSKRAAFEPGAAMHEAFDAFAGKVDAVFLIPTKYRVYHELLEGEGASLPHAQFEALQTLCQSRSLPCYDLTPVLRERAHALQAEQGSVYFRDDTHWNKAGIEAVSDFIRTLP